MRTSPAPPSSLCGIWWKLPGNLARDGRCCGTIADASCGCSSMAEPEPSKLMTRVRFPSPAPSDKYRAGSVLSDPVFCFLLRFSSFARNRGLQARKRGRPIIANGVRPPHRAPRSLPSRIHPAPRHLASSAWKPSALKRGTCFGGQRERVCRFGALPNPHPSPTLVDLSKPCAAA